MTLALIYAERHPERTLGMVLAAVTSGRWRETQWITRDMGRVFPRHLAPQRAGAALAAGLRPAGDALLGHGCFLADDEVMANLHRIAHIPAVLIHGLHDVSGPLDTAWELHKSWPASRLVVVDDAGHFGGRMGQEFVAAIDAMGAITVPL